MSHSSTPAASSAASNTPPSVGSLADLTAQNEARALADQAASVAASRRRINLAKRLGIPLAVVVAGATVLIPTEAEARVLPVPVATAVPGPVTVPSGAVRCKGVGDFHATLSVRTTKKDRKGDHHAAVYLQEQQGGRARMVGYAWSRGATVKVTVCVNPKRIQGGRGPVYLIVEDAIDGYTRPVEVRFAGGAR